MALTVSLCVIYQHGVVKLSVDVCVRAMMLVVYIDGLHGCGYHCEVCV